MQVPAPPVLPAAPRRYRLLLAEDDALIAADVAECLLADGHRVVATLARGAAVLAACRQHRPDALLLNVRLRGPLSGLDVAQTLRDELGPDAPALVFFTAQTEAPVLARMRALGARAVLAKPLAGPLLCQGLNQALVGLG